MSKSNTRRQFLRVAAAAPVLFATRGAFAEQLSLTARQTEGPFYPNKLPLDTDNDLLIINDDLTPAVGDITHLTGRLFDAAGKPIRNAVVEIWQVDGHGVYLHTADQHAKRDANFQGFGRFLTGSTGEYYFRTIKPVQYPGRTPHIHFKVKRSGADDFTTQCYVRGEDQNDRDGIFGRLGDAARKSVLVDFKPLRNSKLGELEANFDIILGTTPEQS